MPARIPTYDAPQVVQARPPVAFQDPGQTAGAFGERAAQAQVETGNALQRASASAGNIAGELAAADYRLQARQDSLHSLEGDNAYLEAAEQLQIAETAGDNFRTDERVQAYRAMLLQKRQEIEQKYLGRLVLPESKLDFQESLAKRYNTYSNAAVEKQQVTVKAALNRRNDGLIGETAQAIVMGASVESQWGVYKAQSAIQYNPGADPEMQAQQNEKAAKAFTTAAYEREMRLGRTEEALAVLNNPIAKEYISDPLFVPTLTGQLLREVKEAAEKEIEKNGVRLLTPAELPPGALPGTIIQQTIKGYEVLYTPTPIVAKPGDVVLTPDGKELFKAPGKPEKPVRRIGKPGDVVTDEDGKVLATIPYPPGKEPGYLDRAATIAEGRDHDKGWRILRMPDGSLKESPPPEDKPLSAARALAYFQSSTGVETAVRLVTGEGTGSDHVTFVTNAVAAAEYDSVTKRRSVLPQHVKETLTFMGYNLATLELAPQHEPLMTTIMRLEQERISGAPVPPPAIETLPQEDQKSALKSEATTLAKQFEEGLRRAREDQPGAVAEALRSRGATFFSLANKMTGFKTKLTRLGFKVPGVGTTEIFNEPQLQILRKAYDSTLLSMTVAMNETPRFADAFRVEVHKLLKDLEGNKWLENPDFLRASIVGLDDMLAVRITHEGERQAKGTMPANEVAESVAFQDTLKYVRQLLAVPPRVKSKEEVLDLMAKGVLKVGDPYIKVLPGGGVEFVYVPARPRGR